MHFCEFLQPGHCYPGSGRDRRVIRHAGQDLQDIPEGSRGRRAHCPVAFQCETEMIVSQRKTPVEVDGVAQRSLRFVHDPEVSRKSAPDRNGFRDSIGPRVSNRWPYSAACCQSPRSASWRRPSTSGRQRIGRLAWASAELRHGRGGRRRRAPAGHAEKCRSFDTASPPRHSPCGRPCSSPDYARTRPPPANPRPAEIGETVRSSGGVTSGAK